jgi:hypothetical protein
MKSPRVSMRRSLDLKPLVLHSVKWAPSYCNHLINRSSLPALYRRVFISFLLYLFFIYINGPDRGSGSTAHPSPVTSSLFLELPDFLGMELLAAFKLKSKVCVFNASVCYCRLQDCAQTGLTQSFRILLVNWPCLIAQREQVDSLWKQTIRISTCTPITLPMVSLFSSIPPGNSVDRTLN